MKYYQPAELRFSDTEQFVIRFDPLARMQPGFRIKQLVVSHTTDGGRSWADLPMVLDWRSRFLLHFSSWRYWPPIIVLEMGMSDKGFWFEYCDPDEDGPPVYFSRSRWRAQFSASRLTWHITRLGKFSEPA